MMSSSEQMFHNSKTLERLTSKEKEETGLDSLLRT